MYEEQSAPETYFSHLSSQLLCLRQITSTNNIKFFVQMITVSHEKFKIMLSNCVSC